MITSSPFRSTLRISSLLALGLSVSLSMAGVSHAQTVTPTAYLTFDEGTGTIAHDSSGNGNNATLQGNAGWTPGLVGPHALGLPGAPGSYASISYPVVDTTKSFTVAAWVRLNNVNGYQTFVSEDGGTISTFFLQLRNDTHRFAFTIPYPFSINISSTVTPVAGQWYHLAGVYDGVGQAAALYVDGILQDQLYNVVASAPNGQTAIGRGQFAGGPVDWVNGSIDDVRLYSSTLTASDILKIAQVGNPGLTGPGPIEPATLAIDAAHPGPQSSPRLFGLMIEEINHGLDGGLYGELIQNRVFKDDTATPVHWSVVQNNGGMGSIALDATQPVPNTALTTSLKVSITQGQRVGAANDGYWGIPVKPFTAYRASFYAKADSSFTGPVTIDIESSDGSVVYAQARIPQLTTDWAQYQAFLNTNWVAPVENTRFVISGSNPGTFWLNQVSVSPPTYRDRPTAIASISCESWRQ
jgi:hypothetical protein